MTVRSPEDERRVLLFTPIGRDSALISETLSKSAIQAQICRSISQTVSEMNAGCAAFLVAEEALNTESVNSLGRVLENQPAWSDLPVIVLTIAGEQSPLTDYKLKLFNPLGNVSLIERPVRPATLISIIRSALRARERQYQFREQAKALQRSNEDLQRFANAASHDLQEPLRMVASYSQLLTRTNEGKLDEDTHLFLRYILNGVDRMRTLIRDLLEFSQHTGAEYPAPTAVDCNAVLRLALQNLEFNVTDRQASITFDGLPVVLGHEIRLLQVFQNLISNALKYCAQRPEIAVSARRDGAFWILSVRDNGIGIASENQEQIFGLFQRLHSREKYPGTGIGLATCQRIVEQYGGRIWVESTLGKGSTFYFTVPATDAPTCLPVKGPDARMDEAAG
jgi:signal transduction histidine kinase